MAHNPVGINSALPINGSSSSRGLDTTAHKTDALRVVAVGAGAHVAIGTLPTATTANYYVSVGEEEVITLGACRNQKVIGITTGATTTIVSSVNNSAGIDGFYSTRIVVNHDSSTGNPAALIPTNSAELRGSFMVAALGTGSGTLHYQQIQSSKGANG